MDDMRIRRATHEDSEFAYQTMKTAFREYAEQVWGWDEERQRKLHLTRFASDDFFVIEFSGNNVGILATDQAPDSLKVCQLFILPGYQNTGIGTACMQTVIEEAKSKSLPVSLKVLRINVRAVSFYQSLGFKTARESARRGRRRARYLSRPSQTGLSSETARTLPSWGSTRPPGNTYFCGKKT